MRILVADDDPVTLDSLGTCLEQEGFEVLRASDGKEALAHWKDGHPELLCLDIMMPNVDGYEVCRRVRAADSVVPILFLSAKSEEIDVVVGLELGADDFVRKPFGTHEFLARVRAAVRRSQTAVQVTKRERFSMGDLIVYPKELRAERDGESVDLSPREVAILTLLHERAAEAVHRDEILDRCWGIDYYPESRTLDQHVAKLRKRIELDPSEPLIVATVRGVGYRYPGIRRIR
ncbi:MAG: two-component system alkaline phosphatase synthesis response regulator PhoP [Pseudoalteromonas tetraodonis]|jgi:two-component system alkaline phosphatase synthesis response regulator PhoP